MGRAGSCSKQRSCWFAAGWEHSIPCACPNLVSAGRCLKKLQLAIRWGDLEAAAGTRCPSHHRCTKPAPPLLALGPGGPALGCLLFVFFCPPRPFPRSVLEEQKGRWNFPTPTLCGRLLATSSVLPPGYNVHNGGGFAPSRVCA